MNCVTNVMLKSADRYYGHMRQSMKIAHYAIHHTAHCIRRY